jgi:hypothetical protein
MKTLKKTFGSFSESATEWYITSIIIEHPLWALLVFSFLKTIVERIKSWVQQPLVKACVSALGISLFIYLFKRFLSDKVIFALSLFAILLVGLAIWKAPKLDSKTST